MADLRALRHFGDPCIHCGVPHDDVVPGPCGGDPAKAIPIAYRLLPVRRFDGFEHFRVLMSDGRVVERVHHRAAHAPYRHFNELADIRQPPRYDGSL